jgi:hypothetical protein
MKVMKDPLVRICTEITGAEMTWRRTEHFDKRDCTSYGRCRFEKVIGLRRWSGTGGGGTDGFLAVSGSS